MNILFDLDGTLTDSRPGIIACIQHALDRAGVPSPAEAELQKLIGPPLRDSFAALLASERDAPCVSAAIEAYRERFTAIGMFENAVYEGIPVALDELSRSGARLYVATSKPRVYAQRILDHFGLSGRFAAIFGSEIDGRLEDKSELIAHVLERTGIDAAATVMIGDREHDMLGATRNGVFPAGVLWGYGTDEELRGAGAKRLLSAPGEISRISFRDF
ncbi:MAG TPA: HAD hydrolase-like protein [Povalibacter sp.]|uniref:HAD hydrolase-like protein n=1 Tax=Povalibacter sp. TaxID=1962978 RepID=UPI002CD3C0D6|nr:HAD hydrolase-like protein [Povalibacter sp.]HMN43520.1 HAD hydrolase-like protein [Povalibacter sp.]